ANPEAGCERSIEGGSLLRVEPDEEATARLEGRERGVDHRLRIRNELQDADGYDEVEGPVRRQVLAPTVQERHTRAVRREVPLRDGVTVGRLDREDVSGAGVEHHGDDPARTAADLRDAQSPEVREREQGVDDVREQLGGAVESLVVAVVHPLLAEVADCLVASDVSRRAHSTSGFLPTTTY